MYVAPSTAHAAIVWLCLMQAPRRRDSGTEDLTSDPELFGYEPYTLSDGEPLWRRIAAQLMAEGLGTWGGNGGGGAGGGYVSHHTLCYVWVFCCCTIPMLDYVSGLCNPSGLPAPVPYALCRIVGAPL
jgi:hypothetical protein